MLEHAHGDDSIIFPLMVTVVLERELEPLLHAGFQTLLFSYGQLLP